MRTSEVGVIVRGGIVVSILSGISGTGVQTESEVGVGVESNGVVVGVEMAVEPSVGGRVGAAVGVGVGLSVAAGTVPDVVTIEGNGVAIGVGVDEVQATVAINTNDTDAIGIHSLTMRASIP